jgi:hypothetical protein
MRKEKYIQNCHDFVQQFGRRRITWEWVIKIIMREVYFE